MVSGSKKEIIKRQVDPCAKCGRRVIAYLTLSTKCGKRVHGRCANTKKVTSTLAKSFIGEGCIEAKSIARAEELTFFDQVKLARSFRYLGNRFNGGDSKNNKWLAKI